MKLAPFLAVIVALNASYASAEIVAEKAAASAAQLRSTIAGAALTSPVKAPLIAQYLKILSAAKCTTEAGGVNCAQASQDQLETAQDALQQLRDDFITAVRQAAATQALAKTFAAAAVQVRSAIANSGLTAAAQAPLITQYLKILSAAKCTSTAGSADCSQASQDQLAAAQTALQQLRLDFTAAHNQTAATLTLAKTFAAAAVQVRSEIAQSGLPPAAQAPLIAQYHKLLSAANCATTSTSADCSQASQAQLATAQDALQQLRYSLTAALKQPAAGQALAQTPAANAGQPQNTIAQPFVTAAGQVRSAIASEGLTAAAQAPLIAQFQKMATAANCTSTANGLDCSKASQMQLVLGQVDLQLLRDALAAALNQVAASQALDQAFAAGAIQVRSAIEQSGLAAAAQSPLFSQFIQILSAAKCTSTAAGVDCSQATQGQLATAQTSLQQLRYALTAALKQAAATQALAETFAASAGPLRSAIADQRLSGSAQAQLVGQLNNLLNAAKCTSTAKSEDCSQSSQAQLATAQAALQQLRVDLTAALMQAAASLTLAQHTFAASAGMVLSALSDKKMYAVQGTFYPQIDKVLSAAKCTQTAAANGVDCSPATQAQLAAAQSGLDTISHEVGQIAATLQASGGLALSQQTFASMAGGILNAINIMNMDAATRANFTTQFAFDLNEASCTNTAKGVDCSKAEQSQLSYAQKLFDTLSSRLSSVQPAPAPKTAGPGTPAAAGLPTSLLILNP